MELSFFVSLDAQAEKNGAVLVLNSRKGWKPAMVIKSNGEQQELSCFERDGNTEAYKSCSLTWQNRFHVFGGDKRRRQISRLNGYKLARIGDLAFDHYLGACSVMANQFIFLCFNIYNSNDYKCRRSTGPLETFSEVSLTTHDHRRTQTSCSESKSSCLMGH